ncbi:hypothetical protein F8M41_011208 [Gigaspora margarita]|uniref:Uncharacterized protein n=1 Tax=Gigaspora margarita TaxID=4874 RepID=A0A8H4B465_GIGMA|nr:hypothetical protein F8M41_011208 [Gigaspora margarita]
MRHSEVCAYKHSKEWSKQQDQEQSQDLQKQGDDYTNIYPMGYQFEDEDIMNLVEQLRKTIFKTGNERPANQEEQKLNKAHKDKGHKEINKTLDTILPPKDEEKFRDLRERIKRLNQYFGYTQELKEDQIETILKEKYKINKSVERKAELSDSVN